jgi:serine-type D-Ala-D-Ala carboxypeptidase/endopeptidase (penicillin-binding protein 4)
LTTFPIYLILSLIATFMKPLRSGVRATMTLLAPAVVIALALPITALASRSISLLPRTTPAAASSSPSAYAALSAQLAHELALAGPRSGAYVYDLSRRIPLFAVRSDVARAPASVEKLYTATTALELMGPAATLTTTVLGSGHLSADGRWEGDLYLRGGGDPTFGSSAFIAAHYRGVGTSVSALAAQLLKTTGIRSVSGGIYGDESYFDSLRGVPPSGYLPDPDLEGELSALSFNRGERGREHGPHALAAYAARQLRLALAHEGVRAGTGGAHDAPSDAAVLTTLPSPTLKTLLGLTLPPSDNFFAETLLKDLGERYGGGGTTAAGAAVVRSVISRFGIDANVLDGSGLSHADATTPRQVVSLLADLFGNPLGSTLREALAVPGRSGTLERRMRHTAAVGRCQGKTGTLIGVSNLAGYCRAAGGDELAFAFFTDGIPIERAHAIQDAMTLALVRY